MPPLFLGFMGQNKESLKPAIDCLACHINQDKYDSTIDKTVYENNSGNYFTYGTRATAPKVAFNPAKVGQADGYQIVLPDDKNCMSCHEHAMVGAVYKRESLYDKTTDVHAARNMSCVDCHATSRHQIARGAAGTDLVSNDRPDVEVSCTASKCHTAQPHQVADASHPNRTSSTDKVKFLNQHTAKLACQSCHVKNDDTNYAKAAMQFVKTSQAEKGYDTLLATNSNQVNLFKGGAVYFDYRWLGSANTTHTNTITPDPSKPGYTYNDWAIYGDAADTTNGAAYGFLGATLEAGYTEWTLNQPGNYAWRWFNGTGTGMANAVASFGFYDPYYFQDGFSAFRGTTQLPAPAGFGSGPNVTPLSGYAGATGLPTLFAGYWASYNNPAMFAGSNSFDKEYYAGVPKGGNGDKIYAFRKNQAWMPVPRTNFWFLTPQDQFTLRDKNTDNTARNYLAIKNAIEAPMMYMFFSKMFKPAMDLYAQEFGFTYMYQTTNLITINGFTPKGYSMVVAGLGGNPSLPMNDVKQGMAGGLGELNGYVYDKNACWLDDNAADLANTVNIWHGDQTGVNWVGMGVTRALGTGVLTGMVSYHPNTPAQGQNLLQAGQLDTYMYFPMPLDANLMSDHAVAGPGFRTNQSDASTKYEPRTCTDCHKPANGTSGIPTNTAKPFDNTDWNPLAPQTVENAALSWASNFDGSNHFDWVTLGYTPSQIVNLTNKNSNQWGVDYSTPALNQ